MNLYKANSSKKKNESETVTKGFCRGVEHHKVGCPRVEHHKVGQLSQLSNPYSYNSVR
jgi:hypothetical protein